MKLNVPRFDRAKCHVPLVSHDFIIFQARRRTSQMSTLFRSYSRYTPERIGEIHNVLVCELATDRHHYVGHNKNYEHFLIPSKTSLLGCWVNVKIVEVSKFYMKADIVAERNRLNYLERLHCLGTNHFLVIVSTLFSAILFWLLLLR